MAGIEPSRRTELTPKRAYEVRMWMQSDLGIDSLGQLIRGKVPWVQCTDKLHQPVRSIMAKARLATDAGFPGEGSIAFGDRITVVDPAENSGTNGVFKALKASPGAWDLVTAKPPEHILQLGSINYFSTVQLDRNLPVPDDRPSKLDVIDICPTVPNHLRFLTGNNRLQSAHDIHARQGDATDIPFGETFDLVYDDMVGSYLTDPQAMYQEVSRVLTPGGLYISRTRHYEDYRGHLQRRTVASPVEPLIDFLTDVFPEEASDNTRQDLRDMLTTHFAEEWNFDGHWERGIDDYLDAAQGSGLELAAAPVLVTPDATQDRVTMTMLLRKPV